MAEQMVFGYGRVSSKDQNEDRQVIAFREMGISERAMFIDKASGKDFEREKYQAMVTMLREGDIVYIQSIDRLGRNYAEILEQWSKITKEIKADIVVIDMPLLDTRKSTDLTGTLISDIVLQLLSYVAEKERASIRERQAQGIAAAKERGVVLGRQPINVNTAEFELVYSEVVNGDRTNRSAMNKLGLKPNTYYRCIEEFKTGTGRWAK